MVKPAMKPDPWRAAGWLTGPAGGGATGAFTKAAGVNVETIRFHQRIGMLLEPDKPYGSLLDCADSK